MYLRMAKRALLETDKRLLWKFLWNMGVKGTLSVIKFKRRLKKGDYFPPFLYVSVINSCNLRCQGCWVDVAAKQEKLDVETMGRLIADSKKMGNTCFGIVGGAVRVDQGHTQAFCHCAKRSAISSNWPMPRVKIRWRCMSIGCSPRPGTENAWR